jgi:hypothetical protein
MMVLRDIKVQQYLLLELYAFAIAAYSHGS